MNSQLPQVMGRGLDTDARRKTDAAGYMARIRYQAQQRESLAARCNSIINSFEHMDIDKEIAVLALAHLANEGDKSC